jgi:hypothetical protein
MKRDEEREIKILMKKKKQKGMIKTGGSFLWKKGKDKVWIFPATGFNEYYVLSEHGADIAFGGG